MLANPFHHSLGNFLRKYTISCNLYADYSQVYLSFKIAECEEAYNKMELVITEVSKWMRTHFICFNPCKVVVLFISSKCNLSKEPQLPLRIGEELTEPSPDYRNIGVTFDDTISMDHHVNMICKCAWTMLRQVGLVKKHR